MQKQQKTQTNPSKSILHSNANLTYIQLGELQKTISDLVQQNRKKHATILQEKPEFAYQLYKISQFQAFSKAFGKQLLLRQLDRLLEEKNYLDRELSLIKFHDEEKTNQKEKMVANQTHHFEILKSIWKKDNSKKYEGTLEHIEELNLMVGQIKCNIQSLIKFQSNDSKELEDTYMKTFEVLHQKNKECQKCHQHQAKIDYLNFKIQGLEEKISKISDENILYLEQINTIDDKLKKTNKVLLKQQTQLKSKIIQLEQQLLKKDQTIKQLKKELGHQQKFINIKEDFEVIIKTSNVDLSRYQKSIQLPLENLLKMMTTQLPSDISAEQVSKISQYSKSTIEQLNQDKRVREFSELNVNNSLYIPQRLENEKIRGALSSEIQIKIQDIEPNKGRYIRTGSKRHRGSLSTQYDEISGAIKANRANLFSKDKVV